MKALKKIIKYLFDPCITELRPTDPNKLSVYMYRGKVMVGNSEWKVELTKTQSNDVWAIVFASPEAALPLANNYYYENCNRVVSC